MTTMETETVGQTDVELFEEWDTPFEDVCEYGGCERQVTHEIVCPCMEGRERICSEHAVLFPQLPELSLRFDRTCDHTPVVRQCTILPL